MSKNAYPTHERISLAHGNGGRLMRELIDGLFARILGCALDTRVDAAVLPLAASGAEWMITTDGFTVRDVWKKGWGGLKTAAEAEAALAVLEEHGHLRSHEASEGTGRPTTRYQINPKLRGAS